MKNHAKQRLHIRLYFPIKAAQLFEQLADHQRLGQLTGGEIRPLRPGEDGNANGLGSVRQIKKPLAAPFEETITLFEPNKRIEYQISKGSPLKDHWGCICLTESEEGTWLDYQIHFTPKIPLPGLGWLMKLIIKAPIAKGLQEYADQLAGNAASNH